MSRGAVGTYDEFAALIEELYEIIIVFAVLAANRIYRQEHLPVLALDDVEIQLGKVLAVINEHEVFRHKIPDPFGKAVVKRL